tara:strand:- start:117 stop:4532 length:4416 start_codon:yes stop_codon:yes gene_type:complete
MDNIYNKSVSINDLYIIYFKKDDIVGNIINIDDIEKTVTIQDKQDNKKELKIDDDNKIILRTDKYEIIDIEKLLEFDEDDFDEITTSILKQDIYPELEIETEEIAYQKYNYTDTEKREIILSELIISYNTNNPSRLKELLNNVNDLLMIENMDKQNYKTKDIINKDELPDWIIPVIDAKPKEYTDEILYSELNEINKLTETSNYKKYLNIILNEKYNAIIDEADEHSKGYEIEHSGRYLTNCLNEGCMMNDTITYFDDRKSTNEINIPIKVDKKMSMVNVIPKNKFNLISMMVIPINLSNYYDTISVYNRSISLYEKVIFNNLRYSNKSFGKYINKNYSDIIFRKVGIEGYESDKVNVYDVSDKKYDKETILDEVNKLPNIKDILERINVPIYNYDDIERLLFIYNIKVSDFNVEDIKYINNLIKLSLKGFKSFKKEYNPIKLENIKINIDDRIRLIKEYIFKQTDITIKNYYLTQFIDKFTKYNLDDNWLYYKHNHERAICKHHVLSSKILYDKDIFNTLISIYGTEPTDGIIYCKNCGEYISEEKFAVTEEFDDDGIVMKDIIQDDRLDILEKLSNNQLLIVERIRTLSRSIGVELNDTDVYEVLVNYELLKNDEFANIRYDRDMVSTTNHPIILEAIEKNVDKSKLKSVIVNTQKYLINTNQLIFLYIVITIYIQTSIPEYSINDKKIELIDFSKKSYETMNMTGDDSSIYMSSITNMISIIKEYNKIYSYEDFWKYSNIFIKEYENVKSTKPEIQIINCIKYIISPYYSKILDRINKYNSYRDKSNIGYIRKYWETYKPNPTDSDIKKINNIVLNNKNDKQYFIRKNISGYSIENITDITSIENIKTKYKQYNINTISLLTNRTFNTLSKYIINLYGKRDTDVYINLLINKLIMDNNDKKVQDVLKRYKYDKDDFDKIVDYSKLKKMLYDINKLYPESKSLVQYNHILFNNIQYTFIITKPKRHYRYIPYNLYSDELITKTTKEKLLNRYCYDKYGKIIYNDNKIKNEKFIDFDSDVHLSNYSKSISIEDIYKTIKDIHKQTRLELTDKISYIHVEQRLIEFIKSNDKRKYDKVSFDKLIEVTTELFDDKKQNYEEIYKTIFSGIIKRTNDMTKEIIEFVDKSPLLNKYLKSIKFGDMFKKIIDGDDKYRINCINNTIMLTILISDNKSQKTIVPKYWMRNQYNSELIQTFLKTKRYAIHNDMFVKSSEEIFKKYFDKSDYFKNLVKYTSNVTKHMDILKGKDDSHFTKKYSDHIQKYLFVNYYYLFVDYIRNISNINNDISNMDTVLFDLLENNNKDTIDESIDVLSSYFIDTMTNMIQEYTDPQWIHDKGKTLSERLGIQREREKQSLIKKLDIMTPEERLLAVQKQNYGISNWYQAAAQENQDYIDSDEYKQATEQERIEMLNEIQQTNTVETDVLGEYGLDKPDIKFQKKVVDDNVGEYDQNNFNDGDDDNDLDGFDRNTIDD